MQILRSARPPWGDYGAILWHGLVAGDSTDDTPLKLERVGPFVPPISFPWPTIVVTDALSTRLRELAPEGAIFRPVLPTRVVRIDWHEWDSEAEELRLYPAGDEPENYILGRKHSTEVASQLPTLWELFVPESPDLQVEGGAFDPRHYADQDVCRGHRGGHVFVSERFKQWLQEVVPQWVSFTPATIVG